MFFDSVLYTTVEEKIIQILTIRSERPVYSDSILRVYNRDIPNSAKRMSLELCVISCIICSDRTTNCLLHFK